MQRSTKVFKRVFFSPTQEEFFANTTFLKNLFSQRTVIWRNRTDTVSKANHFRQSVCKFDTTHPRTDRRATANKMLCNSGVSCFADTFVQGGSSVLRMKFSAKTPRHRKPPKP
jgi:hypothetical protein